MDHSTEDSIRSVDRLVSELGNPLPQKIYLRHGDWNPFHWLVEHFVLWKLERWKNNPRLNTLAIRAALSTLSMIVLGIIAFLLLDTCIDQLVHNNEDSGPVLPLRLLLVTNVIGLLTMNFLIKAVTGFFGASAVAYWKMSDLSRAQWAYCCGLYNESLKATDVISINAIRISLAVDLAIVDLWAHRSFSSMFRNELWKAICFHTRCNATERDRIIREINSKSFKEDEAIRILEAYQGLIVSRHISRAVKNSV